MLVVIPFSGGFSITSLGNSISVSKVIVLNGHGASQEGRSEFLLDFRVSRGKDAEKSENSKNKGLVHLIINGSLINKLIIISEREKGVYQLE